MVDFIQYKYATMLSSRLERYSIKSQAPYKINFRCPICGDSQKSKKKARGWLLEQNNTFSFYCHNCYKSLSFSKFVKELDERLYGEYLSESLSEKYKAKKEPIQTPINSIVKEEKPKLKELKIKKISQLAFNHPAKLYIEKRKIPPNQHYRIFYTPKFKAFVNSVLPNKFEDLEHDEPRLVFPFRDETGNIFGFCGRSFSKTGLRYITIMLEERPKFFGLEKVNFNEPYLILEGPIDSLFFDNAIGMAGADGNLHSLPSDTAVWCYDNECRNKEIHKKMEKVIKSKQKICIWPKYIKEKDPNDMILAGYSQKELQKIIDDNTFVGLQAELKFSEWRKT